MLLRCVFSFVISLSMSVVRAERLFIIVLLTLLEWVEKEKQKEEEEAIGRKADWKINIYIHSK